VRTIDTPFKEYTKEKSDPWTTDITILENT